MLRMDDSDDSQGKAEWVEGWKSEMMLIFAKVLLTVVEIIEAMGIYSGISGIYLDKRGLWKVSWAGFRAW